MNELKKVKREIIIVSVIAAVLVAVFSYTPIPRDMSGTLVSFLFLALPFAALYYYGLDRRELGLTFANWKADLKFFLIFSAVVFPAYTIVYIPYQAWIMMMRATPDKGLLELIGLLPEATKHLLHIWDWSLMKNWHLFILSEIITIALPEELFFRGYLQGRLEKLFTKRVRILETEISLAVVVAAAIFALMHIISIPHPARLGVFIPALIFGFMRARTGTIVAALLFHAASNIFTTFMDHCAFGG